MLIINANELNGTMCNGKFLRSALGFAIKTKWHFQTLLFLWLIESGAMKD